VRVVSHLINIDGDLGRGVADGLGLKSLPAAAKPARSIIADLPPSPALSIIRNGPKSFKGRKLGVLVTDGVDPQLLDAVEKATAAAAATMELVARTVGGVTACDGRQRAAQQKVNGGPSVLYDAVAILVSTDGVAKLIREATAKDFVSDAFAHAKFIAYSESAKPLIDKAGVVPDEGVMALKAPQDVEAFLQRCGQLRLWEREAKVHAV
jgi:catalase